MHSDPHPIRSTTHRQRAALYALLCTVAAAAAVLSFAGLRDLATACGFDEWLSPLLPVTVDAGAAAAAIVWLGRWTPPGARRYARVLALVLLAVSVTGNAVSHALAAYQIRPHWLLVVAVSAVAPAVLGALVHLLVLVGRESGQLMPATASEAASLPGPSSGGVGPGGRGSGDESSPTVAPARPLVVAPPAGDEPDVQPGDRVAELIADGAGRRRLARELGVSEHEARQLLARARDEVAS